jgi:hypothetical protein
MQSVLGRYCTVQYLYSGSLICLEKLCKNAQCPRENYVFFETITVMKYPFLLEKRGPHLGGQKLVKKGMDAIRNTIMQPWPLL